MVGVLCGDQHSLSVGADLLPDRPGHHKAPGELRGCGEAEELGMGNRSVDV